jgi:hypothetical protein
MEIILDYYQGTSKTWLNPEAMKQGFYAIEQAN